MRKTQKQSYQHQIPNGQWEPCQEELGKCKYVQREYQPLSPSAGLLTKPSQITTVKYKEKEVTPSVAKNSIIKDLVSKNTDINTAIKNLKEVSIAESKIDTNATAEEVIDSLDRNTLIKLSAPGEDVDKKVRDMVAKQPSGYKFETGVLTHKGRKKQRLAGSLMDTDVDRDDFTDSFYAYTIKNNLRNNRY